MKTAFVATHVLHAVPRRSVLAAQAELARASTEATTGRLAEPALALGPRTGSAVSLRAEVARLEAILATNAVAQARLSASDAALGGIAEGARTALAAMTAALAVPTGAAPAAEAARSALAGLTGLVNTAFAGAHLFAGIDSDEAPLADLADGVAAAVEAVFEDPHWSAAWSGAGAPATLRIAPGERVALGVTADEPGLRRLAAAYAMTAVLAPAGLAADTRATVLGRAVAEANAGLDGITAARTGIGLAGERIAAADAAMSARVGLLGRYTAELEGVDPFAAATRVNDLMVRIEAAYALTARLASLSLLRHL